LVSLANRKHFDQLFLCFEKDLNVLDDDITLAFVRPNPMLHALNIHKGVNRHIHNVQSLKQAHTFNNALRLCVEGPLQLFVAKVI